MLINAEKIAFEFFVCVFKALFCKMLLRLPNYSANAIQMGRAIWEATKAKKYGKQQRIEP